MTFNYKVNVTPKQGNRVFDRAHIKETFITYEVRIFLIISMFILSSMVKRYLIMI